MSKEDYKDFIDHCTIQELINEHALVSYYWITQTDKVDALQISEKASAEEIHRAQRKEARHFDKLCIIEKELEKRMKKH